MPKHKFDGRWTFYAFEGPPDPNDKLVLNIPNANGHIDKSKSSHGNNTLEGDASQDAKSIHMTEKDSLGSVDTTYDGVLLVDDPNRLVIVGTWVSNLALRKKRLDDGQTDGTWVMTKP